MPLEAAEPPLPAEEFPEFADEELSATTSMLWEGDLYDLPFMVTSACGKVNLPVFLGMRT